MEQYLGNSKCTTNIICSYEQIVKQSADEIMLGHELFISSWNQDRKIRTACIKRDWCEIFKSSKEKKSHRHRIQYPAKLFFKNEGEIDFLRKQKPKEFVTSVPAQQEMLKEFFRKTENYIGQKYRSTLRKEECQRRNK